MIEWFLIRSIRSQRLNSFSWTTIYRFKQSRQCSIIFTSVNKQGQLLSKLPLFMNS